MAADMNNTHKIQSISLGQGQGPVAEKLMMEGKIRGDWVFLQVILITIILILFTKIFFLRIVI